MASLAITGSATLCHVYLMALGRHAILQYMQYHGIDAMAVLLAVKASPGSAVVCFLLQELCARIQHVLSDSAMQTRAATITKEVATYGGVAAAADIALQATSPWGGLNEQ